MTALDLVFMGTPDFSVPALGALLDAGHRVRCVYSQPPRPAGRGQAERLTPVHAFAAERGIEVRTPASLKDPADQAAFAALNADAGVVVAYGLLLPKPVLAAPRLGCLNIHASLLPRWRGAAPIQRAIEAGDEETGVTIMQMDEGLDAGDMLLTGRLPIGPETTAGMLHDALADMGAKLIVEALAGLAAGTLTATPQPAEGVTYAAKLDKAEARLDFSRPASELERRIRAFAPWPGAFAEHGKDRLKILAAALADGSPDAAPGTVVDDRGTIQCGAGALRPTRIQRAGKAPQDMAAFLRGYDLPPGSRL